MSRHIALYLQLRAHDGEKRAFFSDLGDHVAKRMAYYAANPDAHKGPGGRIGNYAADASDFLEDQVTGLAGLRALKGMENLPIWAADRIEKFRKSVPYKALGNLGAAYAGASLAQDMIVPRQLPLAMVAGSASGTALGTAYDNVTSPIIKQLIASKSPWALPLAAGNFMAGKAVAAGGAIGSRALFQRFREMVDRPTFLDRVTHGVTRWGSDLGNQAALTGATIVGVPALAAGTYAAHRAFGLPWITDFTRHNNKGDGGFVTRVGPQYAADAAKTAAAAEAPALLPVTPDDAIKLAVAAMIRSPLVWDFERTAQLVGQDDIWRRAQEGTAKAQDAFMTALQTARPAATAEEAAKPQKEKKKKKEKKDAKKTRSSDAQ